METATQGYALHDVKNVQSFVGLCLTDAIRRNRSRLTQDQREDAHSFLVEMVIREHHKWDSKKYETFSHWVRVAVSKRYIDWLRKELGDTRYKTVRPDVIFLGDWEEEVSESDFSDSSDTKLSIQSAFAHLSEKGKWTLENLAIPISDQVTQIELAEKHGKTGRWVRLQLEALQDELRELGVAPDGA